MINLIHASKMLIDYLASSPGYGLDEAQRDYCEAVQAALDGVELVEKLHHLKTLKEYQSWRRGEDDRTLDETGLTPKNIGEALDWAIKSLDKS